MSLYVCPAAVIAAPCATVWDVLKELPSDAGWLGVSVQCAEPPGPLQHGQTIVLSGSGLGRRWDITLAIDAVDEENGFLDMRVLLPLGMVNHEHMTLAPVLGGECRVTFG